MSASHARAIDFNHLDAYTAGDHDLIREVLRLFRGQVAQLIGVLAQAGDAQTWKDTAHGIKGAARSVGLMALGDACEVAEKLGREGAVTPAQAGVAISAVKDRLGEALEAAAHVEHQLMMKRTFTGVRLD